MPGIIIEVHFYIQECGQKVFTPVFTFHTLRLLFLAINPQSVSLHAKVKMCYVLFIKIQKLKCLF